VNLPDAVDDGMTQTLIEGLAAWELEHIAAIQSAVDEGDDAMFRMARRVGDARAVRITQQRIADNIRKPNGDTYSKAWVAHVEKALDYHDNHPDDSWAECWNYALGRGAHVATKGENEWYTPPQYIGAARRVMGGIDLDPASSDKAQELVQATVYYTKDDDGLKRPWSGRVWMNPPYSKDLIWPFCERLCEFVASGDVSEAVVLVNNATETAAFQRMAELAQAMCFHAKRIKYLNVDLEVAETPVQGQAFVYFGENAEAFHSEFVQFGFTVSL
jgi:ParB family chromosome partitioning protein